jgi:hypothetical protein
MIHFSKLKLTDEIQKYLQRNIAQTIQGGTPSVFLDF